MHVISISDETFARLQRHAVPLVDTIETVIHRALDALEVGPSEGNGEVPPEARSFSPSSPPNLSFTSVKSAIIDGRRSIPADTYWNAILINVVREAARRGLTADEISALLLANHVVGVRDDTGFKFVEEAGVSVQGSDANGAWRATYHLAEATGIGVTVAFAWQTNPKAAHPGASGILSLRGGGLKGDNAAPLDSPGDEYVSPGA
jgi:hypothetical protein